MDLAPLVEAAAAVARAYEDVTTFPAVCRTSRWWSTTSVPAERVRATVRGAAGELLRATTVFDLYRGDQVGEGRK